MPGPHRGPDLSKPEALSLSSTIQSQFPFHFPCSVPFDSPVLGLKSLENPIKASLQYERPVSRRPDGQLARWGLSFGYLPEMLLIQQILWTLQLPEYLEGT